MYADEDKIRTLRADDNQKEKWDGKIRGKKHKGHDQGSDGKPHDHAGSGRLLGEATPVTPALAQVGAPALMEKPAAPPEEERRDAPTTCGPMISDTCLPIETGKFAMQAWWALSFYPGVFTQNWRR